MRAFQNGTGAESVVFRCQAPEADALQGREKTGSSVHALMLGPEKKHVKKGVKVAHMQITEADWPQ